MCIVLLFNISTKHNALCYINRNVMFARVFIYGINLTGFMYIKYVCLYHSNVLFAQTGSFMEIMDYLSIFIHQSYGTPRFARNIDISLTELSYCYLFINLFKILFCKIIVESAEIFLYLAVSAPREAGSSQKKNQK